MSVSSLTSSAPSFPSSTSTTGTSSPSSSGTTGTTATPDLSVLTRQDGFQDTNGLQSALNQAITDLGTSSSANTVSSAITTSPFTNMSSMLVNPGTGTSGNVWTPTLQTGTTTVTPADTGSAATSPWVPPLYSGTTSYPVSGGSTTTSATSSTTTSGSTCSSAKDDSGEPSLSAMRIMGSAAAFSNMARGNHIWMNRTLFKRGSVLGGFAWPERGPLAPLTAHFRGVTDPSKAPSLKGVKADPLAKQGGKVLRRDVDTRAQAARVNGLSERAALEHGSAQQLLLGNTSKAAKLQRSAHRAELKGELRAQDILGDAAKAARKTALEKLEQAQRAHASEMRDVEALGTDAKAAHARANASLDEAAGFRQRVKEIDAADTQVKALQAKALGLQQELKAAHGTPDQELIESRLNRVEEQLAKAKETLRVHGGSDPAARVRDLEERANASEKVSLGHLEEASRAKLNARIQAEGAAEDLSQAKSVAKGTIKGFGDLPKGASIGRSALGLVGEDAAKFARVGKVVGKVGNVMGTLSPMLAFVQGVSDTQRAAELMSDDKASVLKKVLGAATAAADGLGVVGGPTGFVANIASFGLQYARDKVS